MLPAFDSASSASSPGSSMASTIADDFVSSLVVTGEKDPIKWRVVFSTCLTPKTCFLMLHTHMKPFFIEIASFLHGYIDRLAAIHTAAAKSTLDSNNSRGK